MEARIKCQDWCGWYRQGYLGVQYASKYSQEYYLKSVPNRHLLPEPQII